jgi:Zn-dependent membrane protease YugP
MIIILAATFLFGAIMLVIIGLVTNWKTSLAVGGTFFASGVFLGVATLPDRRRRGPAFPRGLKEHT